MSGFKELGLTLHSAFFNGITYVMPKVPTLYSVLTTGSAATDPAVYGYNTHPIVLKKGDIVDIILNNDDAGKHPFHLHGHTFQVIARSEENAGHYDPSNHTTFPSVPMRRDTVIVRPQGNFVLRFQADNPGMYLSACSS
jgi:iron transport multicopper oxidase